MCSQTYEAVALDADMDAEGALLSGFNTETLRPRMRYKLVAAVLVVAGMIALIVSNIRGTRDGISIASSAVTILAAGMEQQCTGNGCCECRHGKDDFKNLSGHTSEQCQSACLKDETCAASALSVLGHCHMFTRCGERTKCNSTWTVWIKLKPTKLNADNAGKFDGSWTFPGKSGGRRTAHISGTEVKMNGVGKFSLRYNSKTEIDCLIEGKVTKGYRGTLSADGLKITWSDGDEWSRHLELNDEDAGYFDGDWTFFGKNGECTTAQISGTEIKIKGVGKFPLRYNSKEEVDCLIEGKVTKGFRGILSIDGRKITWSDGDEWTKDLLKLNAEDAGYFDGSWTFLGNKSDASGYGMSQISGLSNGKHGMAQISGTNLNMEMVGKYCLRYNSKTEVDCLVGGKVTKGFRGRLSADGLKITWSDGDEWTREEAIGCVGDSITAGDFSSDGNHTYPAQLQMLLDEGQGKGKYNVTNMGASGSMMLKNSSQPFWQRPQFKTLTSNKWDIVIIMLGTNDAHNGCNESGSSPGCSSNWTHDCGGPNHTSLESCQYADDFASMVKLVKTLGRTPAGPKVYVMIPPPLMTKHPQFPTMQTTINTLYPKLIPLMQKATDGVHGPINVFRGMGGVPDWESKFPSNCTLNSTWHACRFWCGNQSCGNCHPRDDGYKWLAQLVYAGLGFGAADPTDFLAP